MTSETFFSAGAKWVRADFNLRTLKGTAPEDLRAEFSGREDTFPDAFTARLKDAKINVGVITNHNSFDLGEYRSLAKKALSEDILLLPGIELGVRGGSSDIHILVVFDPQTLREDNDFINRFLYGQFPHGNPDERSAAHDDLAECLNKLEGLGVDYFIVFSHVNPDNEFLNGFLNELAPIYEQAKAVWDARVLAFQNLKPPQNVNDISGWLKQKLPSGMPVPALVYGSGPKTMSEAADSTRGVCCLKISGFDFHSIRFALGDYRLRVIGEYPALSKRPQIHTVEVNGGKRGFFAYRLSPELNTFIGARGSGKSLMIETLRWGLGLESGEGDKTYKKELIHAFLDKGASVTITGENEYGDKIVVTRPYTEKTNPPPPQVSINGKLIPVSVDRVFRGVLYFGQKDLGARQENFYEQFFTQILGARPDELSLKEQTSLQVFTKKIDDYLIAIQSRSEDEQYRYEQESLGKQLKVFKERGVEQRLQDITAFDQDIRRFHKFQKQYSERLAPVENVAAEWQEIFPANDIFKSSENSVFKAEMETLKTKHLETAALFEKGAQEAAALHHALTEIRARLEIRRQELQGQFAATLRELNVDDLDIDEYRKMVSRYEQLSEIRKLTEERGGKTAQFERDMLAAGEAWISALRAITEDYQKKIDAVNERLPANIRIGSCFQGDKAHFRQFLERLFRGSRFDSDSYDKLLAACDNGLDLFKRRKQIVGTELSERMGEIFTEKLNTNFREILVFVSKDARNIIYDNVSVNGLSLGKRAMALLLLLLSLENHPIIILDQPEDDLDNETIHRLLVEPLLRKKPTIQFIVATHNPNLPVLGDAEQVIACYESTRGEYTQNTGSLDRSSIKNAIVNIMEGGKEAFDKRHDIYTLWKKSN